MNLSVRTFTLKQSFCHMSAAIQSSRSKSNSLLGAGLGLALFILLIHHNYKIMTQPCTCHTVANEKPFYSDFVKSGHFRLLSSMEENCEEIAQLECTKCGKIWKYSRIEGYHYPVVEWK